MEVSHTTLTAKKKLIMRATLVFALKDYQDNVDTSVRFQHTYIQGCRVILPHIKTRS